MIVIHQKLPLEKIYRKNSECHLDFVCYWHSNIKDLSIYMEDTSIDSQYLYVSRLIDIALTTPNIYQYSTTQSSLWNLNLSIMPCRNRIIGEKEVMQKMPEILNNKIMNNYKDKMMIYGINKIKSTFGETLRLHFDHTTFKKFLCWLKKYDKFFYNHVSKIPYKPYWTLRDSDFIISLGDYTFARILTGESLKKSFDSVDRINCHVSPMDIEIYVFGKNVKEVVYTLDNINNGEKELLCYVVNVNKSRGNTANIEIYRDISSCRSKKSVFLNDNIKEDILSFVHKFFANKDIYDKRNLNYKTGILLYGEPGTGKSTIANMIATECNCDMVLINMNQFSDLDTDSITSTLNADDKTYIVVLEDIDCVIGNREAENEDLENKKNVNKLLQFLDSNSSPNNVIFVATTNHIEKLDEAILRDGRFDLTVNITNIDYSTASKMCRSFGIKDEKVIERIFNENNVNGKINPAKLQNLILKEIGA